MRLKLFILILIYILIFPVYLFSTEENLDELIARKSRYTTQSSNFNKESLENGSYVWQPETISYIDVTTGSEVWFLIRGPDKVQVYHNEYSNNAWSADGSTLSFLTKRTERDTLNPGCPTNVNLLYRRWMVKSDGTKIKCSEGVGHYGFTSGGLPWANTLPSTYYMFPSGTDEGADLNYYKLYKNDVDANNVVTPTLVINTKTAAGGDDTKGFAGQKKNPNKSAISYDDAYFTGSSRNAIDFGRLINCYGIIKISMAGTPSITNYWGMSRNLGEYGDHKNPSATYSNWVSETTYSEGDRVNYVAGGNTYHRSFQDNNIGHTPTGLGTDTWWQPLSETSEEHEHGGATFVLGLNHSKMVTLHSGDHIHYLLNTSGTDTDNGPKWEAWDGDSYGGNEIIPISTGRLPLPPGTSHTYWGHPQFDPWGKYVLYGGDYTQIREILTTTAWDSGDARIDEGISGADVQYDGRHHFWGGFSDYVGFFPYKVGGVVNSYRLLYGSKLNFGAGTYSNGAIVNVHNSDYGDGNPYQSLSLPSGSPDGTKVAFHHIFLQSSDSNMMSAYANIYFPYPPEIYSTTATGGTVTVRGDWGTNSGTWRGYTQRKWPDESTGTYLPPREVKQWRLWRSADKVTWTPLTPATANAWDRYNFATGIWSGNTYWDLTDTPGDGTWYYAITAIETSGLESKSLSNIFVITVSSGSGSGSQDTTYPTSPGGDLDFYTTVPYAPQTLTTTHQKAPATATGQYTIEWTEPETITLVKYYNIYALDNENPTTIQQRRIASISRNICSGGNCSWVDWLGATNGSTYYGVTTVDTQGNESTIKLTGGGSPPLLGEINFGSGGSLNLGSGGSFVIE